MCDHPQPFTVNKEGRRIFTSERRFQDSPGFRESSRLSVSMRLSLDRGQLPAIPMTASESSSIWPILVRRTEGKMSHLNFMRFSGSSRPLVPQDTELNAGFGLPDHVFSFHFFVATKKGHQPFLRVLKFGNVLPVQRKQSWAQGRFFQEVPRPPEYRACRSLPEGWSTTAETELSEKPQFQN